MGKVLVIAEKPSAAADMAKVLGCSKRGNGCIEGEDYIVTWAVGHLIGLKMPEEHESRYKEWKLEDLPLLFDIEDSLKVLPETESQFEIVKKLINSPQIDYIINAGDAGREGYLIQSWIYRMAGNRKPVKVLWASSLTEEALKKAFQNLKEDSDFENLLQEAEARAEADYLLGMNYSRALTLLKSKDITLSYGRCQTPLLNLIVQRDQEIKNFIPEPFYQLQAAYPQGFTGSLLNGEGEVAALKEEEAAQSLAKRLKKKQAVVKSFETVQKKKKAPLLFNLLELQKEMGKKYKYAPDKTLELTQSLYEKHKMVSYPRTDSQYLSNDLLHEIRDHVDSCRFGEFARKIDNIAGEAYQKADKSYYNDSKVTDHHALIPTINEKMEEEYQALTEEEANVFRAIVNRFLAIFYPPYEYSTTTVLVEAEGNVFRSRGTTVLHLGYKEVIQDEEKEKEEEKEKIPVLQEGDLIELQDIEVLRKKTKAPSRYTVETIVSLMEKHHIGTPATMASIINKLLNPKRQCIYEEKGTYYSTSFGEKYITVVPDRLKSPTLTMEIEEKLEKIGQGEYSKQEFLQEIVEQIQEYIESVKAEGGGAAIEKEALGICPVCGKGKVKEERFAYKCDGCDFNIQKTICNKKISQQMATDILKKGKTGMIKGFSNKEGKNFDARLILDKKEKKVQFEFAPRKKW